MDNISLKHAFYQKNIQFRELFINSFEIECFNKLSLYVKVKTSKFYIHLFLSQKLD